jgi:steroid 5-alpha reductase family enzyme
MTLPRLEAATVAVLLGSVILAVVPATQSLAPVPWVAGMVMVLLSRRWRPVDKALALLGFGILGVPFVLLGRDELAAPASIFTGIVLVALWGATAAWLLRRSRATPEEGRYLRMR